jgi:hypothetical protein
MTDRYLLTLEQLKSLDITALKSAWRAAFKSPPPQAAHKEFFVRFLAHDFQVRVNGGLQKPLSKALNAFEQAKSSAAELAPTETKLPPGTRLLREWGGSTHEVMVLERGYAYRGHSYASLSEIARCVTGARWSGPRFFGLPSRPKRAASERIA